MAGFAFNLKVLVLKFISSFAMVKPHSVLNGKKRIFGVTLFAVLPEFVLMRILMTAGTAGKLYAPELLEFLSVHRLNLVAFLAINCFMFAFELKTGCRMVELRCRLKRFRIVAVKT
jgi:hypothetical protein